jgi:hypothetical protein
LAAVLYRYGSRRRPAVGNTAWAPRTGDFHSSLQKPGTLELQAARKEAGKHMLLNQTATEHELDNLLDRALSAFTDGSISAEQLSARLDMIANWLWMNTAIGEHDEQIGAVCCLPQWPTYAPMAL